MMIFFRLLIKIITLPFALLFFAIMLVGSYILIFFCWLYGSDIDIRASHELNDEILDECKEWFTSC